MKNKGVVIMAVTSRLVCGVVVLALSTSGRGVEPAIAQTLSGQLWTFDGERGDVVEVVATSVAFDVAVELLAPNSDVVASDDDGGMGTDANLVAVLPNTGRYLVRVGSYYDDAVGAYEVAVRQLNVEEVLAQDTARDGILGRAPNEAGGLWALDGTAGQVVRVNAQSAEFDTTVELLAPTGDAVGFNDDGPDSTNSELVAVLPVDGRYVVRVASYYERSGGMYGIAWTEIVRPPLEARGILLQGEAEGTFFDFEGASGQVIRVVARSDEFDTTVEVAAPDGQVLAFNDDGGGGLDSEVVLILSSAGQYRVRVGSYDGGAGGTYEAMVTPVEAPPLSMGAATQGSLVRGGMGLR